MNSAPKITNRRSDQVQSSHTEVHTLTAQAWGWRDTDPGRARALAEDALILAEAYPRGRAQGLTTLSFLDMRENRFDTSLERAFAALDLFGNTRQAWTPRLLNVIALNFAQLGERSQALAYFLEQLEVAQHLGAEEDLFAAYHDLSLYYAQTGDLERGLTYLEKARAHTANDPNKQAFLAMSFAHLYLDKGQLDRARDQVQEALRLSREHRLLRVEGFALAVSAQLAFREQNYAEALRLYDVILQRHRVCNESPSLTLVSMAEVFLAQGDVEEALLHLHEALNQLEVGVDIHTLCHCHKLSYDIHKSQGNFSQALYHHEQWHQHREVLFDEENEVKVRALDVAHRVASLQEASTLLAQKNKELARQYSELEALHAKVKELSIRDALTGLYNRRHLFEQVETLIKLSKRYNRPLSIAMLDIDHFKAVNDTYGHKIGDDVLEQVAGLLNDTLRDADPIARYGGEEFAIVMPETPLRKAVLTCERLRETLSHYDWSRVHPDLNVSVSIGVAQDATVEAGEDLFSLADAQLYRAKRSGRNRVCH